MARPEGHRQAGGGGRKGGKHHDRNGKWGTICSAGAHSGAVQRGCSPAVGRGEYLYWRLGVSMNDDWHRTRVCQEPENLAALRPMALNPIEKEGSKGAMREGSNPPAGTTTTPIGSWSDPEMRSPGSECPSAWTASPTAAPQWALSHRPVSLWSVLDHARDCVHIDPESGFDLCRSGCRVTRFVRQSFELWLPVSRNPRLLLESCGCRNQLFPTLPARDRPSIAGPARMQSRTPTFRRTASELPVFGGIAPVEN